MLEIGGMSPTHVRRVLNCGQRKARGGACKDRDIAALQAATQQPPRSPGAHLMASSDLLCPHVGSPASVFSRPSPPNTELARSPQPLLDGADPPAVLGWRGEESATLVPCPEVMNTLTCSGAPPAAFSPAGIPAGAQPAGRVYKTTYKATDHGLVRPLAHRGSHGIGWARSASSLRCVGALCGCAWRG